MTRRFQFSVRGLLSQVALVAVGLVCLQSIGGGAGPFGSAFLFEASVAAMAAAIGILFSRPWHFAAIGAALVIPLAILLCWGIMGINA